MRILHWSLLAQKLRFEGCWTARRCEQSNRSNHVFAFQRSMYGIVECRRTHKNYEFSFKKYCLKYFNHNFSKLLLKWTHFWGCWKGNGHCELPDCISVANIRHSAQPNITRFCCCTGQMCNENVSFVPQNEEFDYEIFGLSELIYWILFIVSILIVLHTSSILLSKYPTRFLNYSVNLGTRVISSIILCYKTLV